MGPADRLTAHGLHVPERVRRLAREVVDTLGLDLSGLCVLTEAASGYYVVTSAIAALAGAEKVLAVTRDSSYASAAEVVDLTESFCHFCGVRNIVQCYTGRCADVVAQADIITNLGFVRPIDRSLVSRMKPTAVVSLMCEAWELRPRDIDISACRESGILVLATDEDAPPLRVFNCVGPLAVKMVLHAGIELRMSRLAVIGADKFARVASAWLARNEATVTRMSVQELPTRLEELRGCDAIVIADYTFPGPVIGAQGAVTVDDVAEVTGRVAVVQLGGGVEASELIAAGFSCVPEHSVEPIRMGWTFAELGPAPVVWLHAAGLKVGEAGVRARLRTGSVAEAESRAYANCAFVQRVPADDGGGVS